MAGLSLYDDGPTLDSLLDLCGLPAFSSTSSESRVTEVERRNLFDQIMNSGSAGKNPSRGMVPSGVGFELPPGSSSVDSVCVNYSDVPSCLVQKNYQGAGAEDSSYQNLEELFYRIVNEKITKLQDGDISHSKGRQLMDSCTISGSFKRKCESLPDMLSWIKCVATDPCDLRTYGTLQEWRKRRNLILSTRESLFLRITYHLNLEEFPYRRKSRLHQFLCGTSRDISCSIPSLLDQNNSVSSSKLSHDMLNQPIRRSQRSLGLLKFNESRLLRKRVPIGPSFQADVQIWTGPRNYRVLSGNDENANGLRWLGTQIWPVDFHNQESGLEMIGKGRTDLCFCSAPGSVACIRLHVKMARVKMKSNLLQAFSSLGFDDMGEEVSESWACEEQMNFLMLVKLNPVSEGKSFWGPSLNFFSSKSRKNLASYYFNVFVPRRMSIHTRLEYGEVDSDDDEGYTSALDQLYSQRRYSKEKP